VNRQVSINPFLAYQLFILYYARWQHKNKKNRAVKMKNTHNYRRKIKRKNNKIKIRIY